MGLRLGGRLELRLRSCRGRRRLRFRESRGERSAWSDRRVVQELCASLRFFPIFIQIIAITIQAHLAELHGRLLHGVVSGHDNSFLLLLHFASEACSSSTATRRFQRGRSVPGSRTDRRFRRSNLLRKRVLGTGGGAGNGLGGHRVRLVR